MKTLSQCKKLIAESEKETFRPTISHYRDKENGMLKTKNPVNKNLYLNGKWRKVGNVYYYEVRGTLPATAKTGLKAGTIQKVGSKYKAVFIGVWIKEFNNLQEAKKAIEQAQYNAVMKNPSQTTKRASNPTTKTTIKRAINPSALMEKVKLRTGNGSRPVALESFTLSEQKQILNNPKRYEIEDGYVYLVKRNSKNPTKTRANCPIKTVSNSAALSKSKILSIVNAYVDNKYLNRAIDKYFNENKKVTISSINRLIDVYERPENSGFLKRAIKELSVKNPTTAKPKTRANFTRADFKKHQKIQLDELAKMFQGHANGLSLRVIEPDLAPSQKFRLGFLALMKVKRNGAIIPLHFDKESLLSADLKKGLWVSGKDSVIDATSLRGLGIRKPHKNGLEIIGDLQQINYITAKSHIENGETVQFYHKLGEANGRRPKLAVDHDGFPIILGGEYDIWDVGIVN